MWWAGKRGAARKAIAYVGERAVRLSVGGVLLAAAEVDGRDAALAALASALGELARGTRLHVTVSGAICRPFLLPEVAGVTGEADWAAIAATLVEDRVGLPADSPVWLDAGQASPRIAVAIDAAWHRHLLEACGSRLHSLRPWWAGAIEAAGASRPARGAGRGDSAGLAVADSDELVLLIAEGEVYRVAQTWPLDGEPAGSVLSRALVAHDLSSDGVELISFDEVALPGQPVDEVLPFRKEVRA